MTPFNKPKEHGELEGQTCRRKGCTGTIELIHNPDDCCSCHINPPCSYCTDMTLMCPKCEWEPE